MPPRSKVVWCEGKLPSAKEAAMEYDRKMRSAYDAFDSAKFSDASKHFEEAANCIARLPKLEANSSEMVARHVKALNNMAASKDKIGRLAEAEQGYARALKVLRSAWSSYMFPSLWDSNYTTMVAHVEKKLGMMPRTMGTHVGVGVDVSAVVDVGRQMALEAVDLFKAKQYERALPLFEQAAKIYEKHALSDGTTLAACLNNLGSTHAELGNTAMARACYTRALSVSGCGVEQKEHIQQKLTLLTRTDAKQQAAQAPAPEADAEPPA